MSGQDYQKLVVEGKSWSVVNWTQAGSFTDYYIIQGDTNINSINYKKVFQTDDSTFQDLGWYRGALREDTLNEEVFIHDEYSGENKIYVFDLEIGDTAGIWTPSCGGMLDITVIDVDSISDLFGKYRRRMKVTGYPVKNVFGEYWIEGIGSLSGLLTVLNWECVADFNQDMLCYKESDVLTYINPVHNECYISSVSINESKIVKEELKIFPNPVVGTSEIIHNKDIAVKSYKIFDSRGNLTSVVTEPKIIKGNLLPGLYFLKVEMENGDRLTSRFIVQ
jgi:hypothetical protein